MRIAYPMRVDAFDKPGGDLLQVLKYIEAGKISGPDGRPRFEGIVITDLQANLSSFDLIHLTNIDRPVDTYPAFLAAKSAQKPVFLSPIHHSYREIEHYEREGRGGLIGQISGLLGFTVLEYLRTSVRAGNYSKLVSPMTRMMRMGMRSAQQTILRGADRILLLTQKERSDIALDFGEIPDDKISYLRNGLDDTRNEDQNMPYRDIDVCMVGRIEARKNQIAVLKALNRFGVSGVFVGAANQNHRSYCRKFKDMIADSQSIHMGSISHQETLQIMRRSRVHISASWFEVLSLVDLEAYCSGCGVVASNSGGTREMLGDRAVYVFPDSEKSIADGILTMLQRAPRGSSTEVTSVTEKPIGENWSEIGERLTRLYCQNVK
jgi:glycosyltransferase involved in cell wall biosynthesis